uniref:Uncharacterized protein n=1 Tax=Lepeophtheirus salmonis TaxID=72036 RepID=A0A0K2TQQ8_LEPSM
MSSLSSHHLLCPAPKGFACPNDFRRINSIPLPRNGAQELCGEDRRDLFSLLDKPLVLLDAIALVGSPVLFVGEEDDSSSMALQVIEETLTVGDPGGLHGCREDVLFGHSL